jgi:hypothetical protein
VALVEAAAGAGVTLDVNAPNAAGHTPLHVAAASGGVDVATWLVAVGASCTSVDALGNTPAHAAAHAGHAAVLAVLRKAGGGAAAGEVANAWGLTPAATEAAFAGPGAGAHRGTALLSHPSSLAHTTCNDLARAAPPPPPENVKRLRVLLDAGSGLLREPRLDARLTWRTVSGPAKVWRERSRGVDGCGWVGGWGVGGGGMVCSCSLGLACVSGGRVQACVRTVPPCLSFPHTDFGRAAGARVPVCAQNPGGVCRAARRHHRGSLGLGHRHLQVRNRPLAAPPFPLPPCPQRKLPTAIGWGFFARLMLRVAL